MPFLAEGDAVIASLGFRTATPTGLNCLAKMAIWNNDSVYMRPTGTPIGYNDTAVDVSAVDTNYSIALSGSPNFTYGNIYWLGLKATAPAGNVYSGFLCIRNSSIEYMNLIGHQPIDESENGFYPFANTGIQVEGLSINTVFTSAMSTTNITPSANIFYAVTGIAMPSFFFGVQ